MPRYDAAHGSSWTWQSAGSVTAPSPLGGDAPDPNPTDRGKLGTKRHSLSDERGAPLSVAISGANRHAMKVADAVLDGIVVERPTPTPDQSQHLYRDKAFDYPETRRYVVHTPIRGVDTPPPPPDQRFPARRWVVERSFAWKMRFRKLKSGHEKQAKNYPVLVQFACCPMVYRLRRVLG